MVPRRTFPAGGHAGPPLRKVRAPQRVGADLCVGPCPAREGQRQRLRSRWRLCRLTLDSRPRICRATDVASPLRGDAAYPLRVKSAQRVSGTSPGRRLPQGQRVSVPDCRAGQPTFPRRRQEVRAGADRPAETFFLFHRAVAQPLAALPPYGCGIPLAGTAHLSPPKSRRKRRLAPTRVCGRSLFDVSNRGPRRAPRGGERRRSGGSETWPCGPGRTIRSLCRRQWGVDNGGCIAQPPTRLDSPVQWDALSAPPLKGAHYVPPHRSKRDPAGPPDHRHL